ncbi:60S ribosomal export protein NMD3 [Nymphon striatum]|nr:60S ribosomal export protein NMD3 [Nymphon striatum]
MDEEFMIRTENKVDCRLCCECGASIESNPANMCVACIRTEVDITEGIPKQASLYFCKGCERYLQPPSQWVFCSLESRELLALCLKKLKSLNKIRLVDASFVWTEPHSKRIKVKLTIQKEVISGAVLEQVFIVEYVVNHQMCTDCHRTEAKDYWKAVVQVRQKTDHKKTFYYVEQLILKHSAHSAAINIKPINGGIDFYFAKKDAGRHFVDFLLSTVPCKYMESQHLVSHDIHNNTFNYKFTFSVEIVPICKDNVVCLPSALSRQLGNISQICICYGVSNSIRLINPANCQVAELAGQQFWRNPCASLCGPKQLTEYIVMDIEIIRDKERQTFTGQGRISDKHIPANVWVVRASELGMTEDHIHCRTHIGHLLKPGDSVLGFDIANSNVNDWNLQAMKADNLPDVIIVKKVYGDRTKRIRKRKWKLKHLPVTDEVETASNDAEYNEFLEDLEEDVNYRQNVNIFVDHDKIKVETDESELEDIPRITLQEMMDDLILDDVDMADDSGSTAMN